MEEGLGEALMKNRKLKKWTRAIEHPFNEQCDISDSEKSAESMKDAKVERKKKAKFKEDQSPPGATVNASLQKKKRKTKENMMG